MIVEEHSTSDCSSILWIDGNDMNELVVTMREVRKLCANSSCYFVSRRTLIGAHSCSHPGHFRLFHPSLFIDIVHETLNQNSINLFNMHNIRCIAIFI